MLINTQGIIAEMQSYAKHKGISVIWQEGQPHTDGKKVVSPSPNMEWQHDSHEYIMWRGHILHEIFAHNSEDTADLWEVMREHGASMKARRKGLLNVLEDARGERMIPAEYVGVRKTMGESNALILKKKNPPSDPYVSAGTALLGTCFSLFQPEMVGFDPESMLSSEEARELYAKWEQYIPKIMECETAEQSYQLACEMIDDEEDEASPDSEEVEVEANKHKPAPAEGDNEEGDAYGNGTDSYTDEEASYERKKIEDKGVVPIPDMKEVFDGCGLLANTLRQWLQAQVKRKWEQGKKVGRVSGRNLYRVGMGIEGFSERVFRQKVVKKLMDTSVCVLVDCSGSMSGDKYNHAAGAATALSKVLGVLGVDHSVLGFTADLGYTSTTTYVLKDWAEGSNPSSMLSKFSSLSYDLGNNDDGSSVLHARDELMKRSGSRKILIVLSDGEPAASRSYNTDTYLKNVVRDIERSKAIEIHAIGILTSCVQHYYKSNQVLRKAHELPAVMLGLLKTKIFGGVS